MSKVVESDVLVDVEEAYSKTETFVEQNKKTIMGILFGIVIGVGAYFAYKQLYVAPMEQEAQQEMYKSENWFAKDSMNIAINGMEGNSIGFLGVIDDYGATKAANLSHYYAGIGYLKMGQYDNAIDMLEGFSSSDVMLSAIAVGAIGDAYMELGQKAEAISYYKKASSKNENMVTSPFYLLKLGITYEGQQDYASALEVYNRIKKDFPKSTEARDIEKYIAKAEALNS